MARVHVIPFGALVDGKAAAKPLYRGYYVVEFNGAGLWKSTTMCVNKTQAVNTAIAIRARIRKESRK